MTTWKDGGNYGNRMREIVNEDGDHTICHVQVLRFTGDYTEHWPQGMANFRLILAAPQMLEALEAIRDRADNMMEIRDGTVNWTHWQPIRSIANAAIAAAKGEDSEETELV